MERASACMGALMRTRILACGNAVMNTRKNMHSTPREDSFRYHMYHLLAVRRADPKAAVEGDKEEGGGGGGAISGPRAPCGAFCARAERGGRAIAGDGEGI